MTTTPPQNFLRQRNPVVTPKPTSQALPAEIEFDSGTRADKREVVWGKTPAGDGECPKIMLALCCNRLIFLKIVFRVPTTHDVLTALFHPSYPKSHFDLLNLGLLGMQLLLFFFLPYSISRPFFLCYFAFWRAAYDAGLGWVLTQQSKRKWVVREIQRLGWLDEKRRPAVRSWIRAQLVGKMGKDYSFDVCYT
jgi:phosphatidylethanolamine N-methyltransferase